MKFLGFNLCKASETIVKSDDDHGCDKQWDLN